MLAVAERRFHDHIQPPDHLSRSSEDAECKWRSTCRRGRAGGDRADDHHLRALEPRAITIKNHRANPSIICAWRSSPRIFRAIRCFLEIWEEQCAIKVERSTLYTGIQLLYTAEHQLLIRCRPRNLSQTSRQISENELGRNRSIDRPALEHSQPLIF